MKPWLTVVTVVKDDPEGLKRTAASLQSARHDGIEHLIVDSSRVPVNGIQAPDARILHEPPRGVYAAMNTGVLEARGEFVWFLNAGDEAATDEVLARIQEVVVDTTWAFGPVIVVDRSGKETRTPAWSYQRERARAFARGHFPAHQGTIVRRQTLMDLGGFDTSFRICADYAMALHLSRVSDPVVIDTPLARFYEGGLSTAAWRESVKEFHRARREVLDPKGLSALVEGFDTGLQFVKLGLYRTFLDRRPA